MTSLMLVKYWIFTLISIILTVIKSECQILNTPPIMYLDRNWRITETEPVGGIVARVRAEDSENDSLEFGLESLSQNPLNQNKNSGKMSPFWINPDNGIVTLNESLVGRGGENFFLYVTVNDGKLTAKNEVYVNILSANSTNGDFYKTRQSFTPNVQDIRKILPPSFPGLNSGMFGNPISQPAPPPMIPTPPRTTIKTTSSPILTTTNDLNATTVPIKQTKTYPDTPITTIVDEKSEHPTSTTTKLKPIETQPVSNHINESFSHTNDTKVTRTNEGDRIIPLATFLPVIIAVSSIFLVAAGVALFIFRKYLCAISKTLKKKNKIDKAKKSNQSNLSSNITSTEDSRNSIGMNHWNGPMAFNNRYTSPWDNQHQQVTSQLSNNSSSGSQINGLKDRWEFPRHRLKVFNILGEGAFGQVWRCEATDIEGVEGLTTVAVKTLKENASESERNDLLSELQVMKSLEPHVNVVRLLGCCTEKDPVFVIIEYVNLGKLQTYLRNSRVEKHYGNTHGKSKILTGGDLTSFMYQVARGMDFLASRGIIHRDLAARNVLICDNHVCKVADFGFARDIETSKVYERKSEGRLPIRWMAVESLYDNIFTVKSDIWSFGILMWEIVTLGSTPYPGIAAAEVMKKIRDGYRLEKPEHCRRELYNIMFYCWAKDPNERPDFPELIHMLDKLLLTETDYIELERFPDHNYYNMLNQSGEKL